MAEQRDENGVYIGPTEKTIALLSPIGDLTQITLKEPDAGQLSAYFTRVNTTSDNGIVASTELIAAVSGILPVTTAKLKQRDLDACGEFLAVFGKAQPKPTQAA